VAATAKPLDTSKNEDVEGSDRPLLIKSSPLVKRKGLLLFTGVAVMKFAIRGQLLVYV